MAHNAAKVTCHLVIGLSEFDLDDPFVFRRLVPAVLAVLNFHSIIVSNVDKDTMINLFDTETTPNTTYSLLDTTHHLDNDGALI